MRIRSALRARARIRARSTHAWVSMVIKGGHSVDRRARIRRYITKQLLLRFRTADLERDLYQLRVGDKIDSAKMQSSIRSAAAHGQNDVE